MKKSVKYSIIFLICIAGVLLFLLPYLPSTANIVEVKQDTVPELKKQLSEKEINLGSPIFIRIFKASSELEVWIKEGEEFQLLKTYPICYFSGELGPKLKEGDKQSPEGFYAVSARQMNPNSSYHLAFNIGFPNKFDRAHHRTGSYLMVHGSCVSIGCYAVTDKGIEEIYLFADAALNNGQSFFRVHIFPFRMNESNMHKYRHSKWNDFWKNLKEGYDFFETFKRPPNVEVINKRYVFN